MTQSALGNKLLEQMRDPIRLKQYSYSIRVLIKNAIHSVWKALDYLE